MREKPDIRVSGDLSSINLISQISHVPSWREYFVCSRFSHRSDYIREIQQSSSERTHKFIPKAVLILTSTSCTLSKMKTLSVSKRTLVYTIIVNPFHNNAIQSYLHNKLGCSLCPSIIIITIIICCYSVFGNAKQPTPFNAVNCYLFFSLP